jgi:hypothetical protein
MTINFIDLYRTQTCGKNMHHYPTINAGPCVCVRIMCVCVGNLSRNLGRGWRLHCLRLDKQQEQERVCFSCRAAQPPPACRPRGTPTYRVCVLCGWLSPPLYPLRWLTAQLCVPGLVQATTAEPERRSGGCLGWVLCGVPRTAGGA